MNRPFFSNNTLSITCFVSSMFVSLLFSLEKNSKGNYSTSVAVCISLSKITNVTQTYLHSRIAVYTANLHSWPLTLYESSF